MDSGNKALKSRKTSVKKGTANPVYNEALNFELPSSTSTFVSQGRKPDNEAPADRFSLLVSVFAYSSNFGRKHELLGSLVIGKKSPNEKAKFHWETALINNPRTSIRKIHSLVCPQISTHGSSGSGADLIAKEEENDKGKLRTHPSVQESKSHRLSPDNTAHSKLGFFSRSLKMHLSKKNKVKEKDNELSQADKTTSIINSEEFSSEFQFDKQTAKTKQRSLDIL